MVMIYGIPNCDIVKKSLDWFSKEKIPFQFHNFKTQGISESKLLSWINNAGLDRVINKRSTTWRNLSPEKQAGMSDVSKAIEILREEPSIIKRPVVESERLLLIGFNEQDYKNNFAH